MLVWEVQGSSLLIKTQFAMLNLVYVYSPYANMHGIAHERGCYINIIFIIIFSLKV